MPAFFHSPPPAQRSSLDGVTETSSKSAVLSRISSACVCVCVAFAIAQRVRAATAAPQDLLQKCRTQLFCASQRIYIRIMRLCHISCIHIPASPAITFACKRTVTHYEAASLEPFVRHRAKRERERESKPDGNIHRQAEGFVHFPVSVGAPLMSARIKRFGISIVLKDVKLESFLRLACVTMAATAATAAVDHRAMHYSMSFVCPHFCAH